MISMRSTVERSTVSRYGRDLRPAYPGCTPQSIITLFPLESAESFIIQQDTIHRNIVTEGLHQVARIMPRQFQDLHLLSLEMLIDCGELRSTAG